MNRRILIVAVAACALLNQCSPSSTGSSPTVVSVPASPAAQTTGAQPGAPMQPGAARPMQPVEHVPGTSFGPKGEPLTRCRNRADCGGNTCCDQMGGGSFCSSNCPPATSFGVRCDAPSDCPAMGPGPGGMAQRYAGCVDHLCAGGMCNPSGTWVPCDQLQ
ncbi:MAG: hypothetical protein HY898_36915 [Deltaproteobacteria bacterium]|nr:hypothetical protein [Deltaproteobacteria bacterium]